MCEETQTQTAIAHIITHFIFITEHNFIKDKLCKEYIQQKELHYLTIFLKTSSIIKTIPNALYLCTIVHHNLQSKSTVTNV